MAHMGEAAAYNFTMASHLGAVLHPFRSGLPQKD